MDRRAFRVDPQLVELARKMRHDSAPAEQKVWSCLRNRKLNGCKFRRQVVFDRYIADFYCAECKLIVELDGDSHFEPGKQERDGGRTDDLQAMGYVVLRFKNIDVFQNLDGLLEALLEACEGRRNSALGPSPLPSPPSTGARE